jgi:methionyl-tRNA formyltransferase
LHDRLAVLGAEALLAALPGITDGSLHPQTQPADGVTYAAKITKDEARIDWTRPAIEIDRQIRAFNPWPIAETVLDGSQLRVWSAVIEHEHALSPPGTILRADDRGIHVATGAGILVLTQVQVAGRKSVAASEFARGQRLGGIVLGT